MFQPNRTSMTGGVAVVAVIAGLSSLLTAAAVPPASAEPRASVNSPAAKPAAKPEGNAVRTAREVRGAAGVVPLAKEPPAKIIVDPPLPDQLASGRVVIQYRTENLRIL